MHYGSPIHGGPTSHPKGLKGCAYVLVPDTRGRLQRSCGVHALTDQSFLGSRPTQYKAGVFSVVADSSALIFFFFDSPNITINSTQRSELCSCLPTNWACEDCVQLVHCEPKCGYTLLHISDTCILLYCIAHFQSFDQNFLACLPCLLYFHHAAIRMWHCRDSASRRLLSLKPSSLSHPGDLSLSCTRTKLEDILFRELCVWLCACVSERQKRGVLGYEVEGLLSASELEVFEGLLRSSAFLPLFYFHPSLRSCHM